METFAFSLGLIYILLHMYYNLPRVLKQKKYYHYSLSFKGSTLFLAFPHNRFGQSSAMKPLYYYMQEIHWNKANKELIPQWALRESKKYSC